MRPIPAGSPGTLCLWEKAYHLLDSCGSRRGSVMEQKVSMQRKLKTSFVSQTHPPGRVGPKERGLGEPGQEQLPAGRGWGWGPKRKWMRNGCSKNISSKRGKADRRLIQKSKRSGMGSGGWQDMQRRGWGFLLHLHVLSCSVMSNSLPLRGL